jgi:hypothetical protein
MEEADFQVGNPPPPWTRYRIAISKEEGTAVPSLMWCRLLVIVCLLRRREAPGTLAIEPRC